MPDLLRLERISKRFPGVQALADVSFEIEAGEVHALIGENGAGKSTLIKIITGSHAPDGGALVWKGARRAIESPQQARGLGISFIHQHRTLVPAFTGYENCFLGKPYPRRPGGRVDWATMKRWASEVLKRLDYYLPLDEPVRQLSAAQQTMVELVRALLDEASLIVLDEPTAALTDREAEALFATMERLRAAGLSFLYVSHRMPEIFQISDRVTVLRNGRRVGTWRTESTTKEAVIRAMTDTEAGHALDPPPPSPKARPILELAHLTTADGRVREVSLQVNEGEVLGLFGLVGAGRSELLQAVYGANKRACGRLLLRGREVVFASPADAMRSGVAFVPEDRRKQSLVTSMNVRENVTLPHLSRFLWRGGMPILSRAREQKGVLPFMDRLGIRATGTEQRVQDLSGGNQQKLVLAKALMSDPAVLLCDEPTHGVDVGARREIYEIFFQHVKAGGGILLASSDLEEVLAVSHRVGVMREGRLVAILPREAATQEKVLALSYGEAIA